MLRANPGTHVGVGGVTGDAHGVGAGSYGACGEACVEVPICKPYATNHKTPGPVERSHTQHSHSGTTTCTPKKTGDTTDGPKCAGTTPKHGHSDIDCGGLGCGRDPPRPPNDKHSPYHLKPSRAGTPLSTGTKATPRGGPANRSSCTKSAPTSTQPKRGGKATPCWISEKRPPPTALRR